MSRKIIGDCLILIDKLLALVSNAKRGIKFYGHFTYSTISNFWLVVL